MHDPHSLRGMLKNIDLLEVQVASIARGPHLALMTALEIADLHRKLDDAEARLREAATREGLDAAAPLAVLRKQVCAQEQRAALAAV